MVLGGGICGGQVIGASDERGVYVGERKVTQRRPVRDDLQGLRNEFGSTWTKDPVPQPWVAATSRTANQRNCTSLRSACSAIRSSSPCAPRPAAKSASSRTAPNP